MASGCRGWRRKPTCSPTTGRCSTMDDHRDRLAGGRGDLGYWCEVLSHTAHQHCQYIDCTCPHHLPLERGTLEEDVRQPRPHSYPWLDWSAHKPPGWHEAEKLGQPFHRKRGWR